MVSQRLKVWYFTLEALNALSVSYFFNYLFFYCRDRFGFGELGNLLAGALHGLVYMGFVLQSGRFAQRHGYLTALRVGCLGMAAVLIGASLTAEWVVGQMVGLGLWTWAMSFTWPALEALVSEGETAEHLPKMIGLYNLIWAGGAALAYFVGGTIFQELGPRSLYWLPVGVHLVQWGIIERLARQTQRGAGVQWAEPVQPVQASNPISPQPGQRSSIFLKMAWWSNPFAYVAMNTVQPLIPLLAARLGLSTAAAGVFASVWLFARLAAFGLLWRWTGWHYRFGWLLGAYGLLVGSFMALLLAQQLWWLVLAQVGFGLAVGLIYYSSLFYSMDLGKTKGEHGGLHERAIGVGLFVGPTLGSASLWLAPDAPKAGIWAVSAVLGLGLLGLLWLRWGKR
jgi:predicted MFS family arabinose efflux permease